MELEKLLNKLIEKGWCPANRTKRWDIYKCEVRWLPWYVNVRFFLKDEDYGNYGMDIRELVSKESGLWQFVCENGMVEKNSNDDKYNSWQKNMYNSYMKRDRAYAKYRIIESALCDEDKLEKFLLDNIKIS